MERAAARELQQRSLEAFVRIVGRSSAGGVLHQAPGLLAAITPAAPERSILNSVIPRDLASLEAGYDELAERFAATGVQAWTVWIDEDDRDSVRFLESRGHSFDGDPVAMSLDSLDAFAAPELGDLDWDADADPATVGRVNGLAYGLGPDEFVAAIANPPADIPFRLYRARVDGETAAVLTTCDIGDDCSIYLVATLLGHRGRGLCPRLLAAALRDARERGLRTSSLQASKLGYPVYARLGYSTDYRLTLWERRVPA